MRLIDADELLNDLLFPNPQFAKAFKQLINDTPTVDAVEVVRCKDCKWWKTNYSWNGNEHKICVREPYEPLRNSEDFCSRGERKEE